MFDFFNTHFKASMVALSLAGVVTGGAYSAITQVVSGGAGGGGSVTQATTPWIVAGGGTAGAPGTAVLTVQGIASGTTVPVSGTVTVNAGTGFASDAVLGTTTFTEASSSAPGLFVRNDTLDTLVNTNNEFTSASVTAEGGVWTATSATTNGGCTAASVISAGAVLETQIKGSAGQLYKLAVTNLDATPVYIRVYNDTSAGLDEGSDTPVLRYGIPAAPASDLSGREIKLPEVGVAFSVGIIFRVTTGIADNDTGALTANEVLVSYCYK